MRKIIYYITLFLVIPIMTVMIASIFVEQIKIGGERGNESISRLGKEITVEVKGLCKTMDVEEYVVGVLAGVIPSDYDEDAIMAQAVVVRTNVLKEMEEKKTEEAKDISYHYLSVEERKEIFGEEAYEKKERKIEKAVAKTTGQVLVWDGELIMALYHEVSMGKTLSAKEVFGEDIPYLQSVDSTQDVESSNYMQQQEYTWKELDQLLGQANTKQLGVDFAEVSENGVVKKVVVGTIEYTGEDFAKKIGLNSVIYEKEEIENGIRFIGLGSGHGMGMSMYGANARAQQGESYDKILDVYYSGAVLAQYQKE